ncbi:MAG: hypothetical protein M3P91_04380 [Actinomycetota bacterium]|nr:hypothetical protein [Actinomycetota bacterium]
MVLKAPDGSEGQAVSLVRREADLPAAFARLRMVCGQDPAGWAPLLVQQCITESLGRDKRVLVVGEHAVACMERVARPGEWRSNLSQTFGGAYEPALRELADRVST